MVSSCVDAPSAPDPSTFAPYSGPGVECDGSAISDGPMWWVVSSPTPSWMAPRDAQIQTSSSRLTELNGIANGSNPAVVSNFTISGNAALLDCNVPTEAVDVIELRNPGRTFGVTPFLSNVPCAQQD